MPLLILLCLSDIATRLLNLLRSLSSSPELQQSSFLSENASEYQCVNKSQTVFRPRRSRSVAAYSRQTFPWTICRSVGPYVRPYVGLSSALWKNGGSDPDAVWLHRSDGSMDKGVGGV